MAFWVLVNSILKLYLQLSILLWKNHLRRSPLCTTKHSLTVTWVSMIVPLTTLLHPMSVVAHKCRFPGCGEVMVLDGNCKNRRDICDATEAGYVEYSSLPGAIKTGCQLTPMRSSQYCYHHSPRISPSLALPDPDSSDQLDQPHKRLVAEHRVVKFILGRKTTRNQIYYQVIPHDFFYIS